MSCEPTCMQVLRSLLSGVLPGLVLRILIAVAPLMLAPLVARCAPVSLSEADAAVSTLYFTFQVGHFTFQVGCGLQDGSTRPAHHSTVLHQMRTARGCTPITTA